MKRLQSLSYKTLFTILFLSLAGIVFFIRIGGKTQKVSAAWWDEMWHYRKAIQINNSGTNRTNIQFKLFTNYDLSSLVSAGKIQADLDDLRFTDINGNLLNYWIEDPTNNSADIWIVLNSLPNSGTTVYLYYGNSSATSGQTIMGKTPNNPGISCKAIQLSGGSDGVYYIDPTGLEATDAYQTYCDMSGNGGGWTLLMKSEGNTTTFNYNANYWTTTNTLNPNDADINQNTDAKFESFNSLLIDQIRATWPSTGHTMVETISTTTALGLFQTTVDLGPSMAQFDYTNFPYQTGYQSYGFNLTCAAANKVRWGWMFNNETTCSSNDCSAGIGLMTVYSTTNGGYVTCCSSLAVGGYPYRVRIWGRENNIVTPNVSFINTTPQSEESSTGPIAYWKFDEGVGTTVYDSAGTSNGTFTGTTFPEWQSEENCISGKCLKIQKTNSYVNTINQLSLSEITVSVWVKISSFNTLWQNIILHRGNAEGGSGFYIRAWEGGSVQWLVGNNSGSYIGINSGALTPNKWHHIVGTAKIGEPIKLYIDNKLYSGSTISSLNLGNTSDITFGRSDYAINGSIDEFKIYPYARTADQIKQDYNSRGSASSNGSGVNMGTNINNNSLSDGLIGYWKMDEASWNGTTGEVKDYSGNNNNGTAKGTTLPSLGSGKFGNGAQINGVNNYVAIGYTNPVTSTSVVAWFKRLGTPAGGYHVITGGGNIEISIPEPGGQIRTGITTSTMGRQVFNSGSGLIDGNWHQLAMTYDGSKLVSFIDGIQTASNPVSGNLSGIANEIGRYLSNTYVANGIIDEVRIYNRALSPAEVSSLYNYAPGPVGYWDFNEKTGTITQDKSGNSNNGTLVSSPIWTQGKIGGALNFNGTNNYVYAGNTPSLNPNYAQTISSWVKLDTILSNQTSNYPQIMGKRDTDTQRAYFLAFEKASSKLYWEIKDSAGTYYTLYSTKTNWNVNEWYYITATFDGSLSSNNSKIFVNGILDNQSTWNLTYVPQTSAATKIGGGNYYLDGSLDEVKLYNYARTQKQIIEDMNAGAPATSAKSMVAYYKFDEGNGVTVKNQVNNNYTLTSSGQIHPTVENNGKINKSLYFHGIGSTNRSYMYTTPINIGNSGTLSFSFWVNPDSLQSGDGTIIRNGVGMDQNYKILIGSPSSNKYKIFIQRYNGTWESTSTNNYLLSSSEWSHVSIVLTESLSWKFYLNGKYIETISIGGTVPNSTSYLAIGGHGGTISQYLNGYLDEIKIYNYALTDEEIKQDYNAGSAIQFGSTSQSIGGTTTSLEYCIPGDTSYCAPPIAEYKMDEGVGTSIVDTSGNNNTGAISGTTFTQGKIGKSLSFNGTSDYVSIPTFTYTTNATISVWVKGSYINGNQIIVGSPNSVSLGIYNIGSSKGVIGFSNTSKAVGIANNFINDSWNHLSVVIDNSGNATYYCNGQLLSNSGTNNWSWASGTYIGRRDTGTYFKGQIDQLKIYNYARTPAQITYDYNKGGPVGWWKFDECQGNTAYDWSGNQNNGTITVGASGSQNSLGTCAIGTSAAWTNGASGKINSSLNFDGSDDYMLIPYSSVWKNKDFSASFWIKPSGSVDIETGYTSHWFYSPEGFGIVGYGGVWINNSSGRQSFSGCNFNNPNMWSHLTLTYNQDTGIGKFYVNSKLNCSISLGAGTAIPWNTSSGIYVGGTDSGSYNGPGQIDDIRIFPYALTSEQIKQIYNGGAVNFR